MIKIASSELPGLEKQYPGILAQLDGYEKMELQPCSICGSPDTAITSCGMVGRVLTIAAATSKIKLTGNPTQQYRTNPGRFQG